MKLDLRPLLAGDKQLAFDYELTLDTSDENPLSSLSDASFPSPMKVKGDITNTAGYMRMAVEKIPYGVYRSETRSLAAARGPFIWFGPHMGIVPTPRSHRLT